MQNDLICPKCKKPLFFGLDEQGRTPWHLHCVFCNINIGANKPEKAIELIQKYNKKDTYLEYYDNNIQVLFEEGKRKIFKEMDIIINTGTKGISLKEIIKKLGNKSYPFIEVRCRWEENEYNYNEYIGSCSYDNKTKTLSPHDSDSYSLDNLYEEWEEWKDDNGQINLTVWEARTIEEENDYAK